VIDVYFEQRGLGKSDREILIAMTEEIKRLGPYNVSNHCATTAGYAKMNVFDVSKNSISGVGAFANSFEQAKNDGLIDDPRSIEEEKCFHFEITIK
jgi:hypothetical protein